MSGTPTDCVYLALHHFMKDAPPDVVISGINHGSNLGTDAHYSGTMSAAHEGMVNGIPSVAFSLVGSKPFDFTKAAQFAGRLTRWVGDHGLPPGVMLNCNVPQVTDGRSRCAAWGAPPSVSASFTGATRAADYYWIGGTEVAHAETCDSDTSAHDQGLISITPLGLDLTAQKGLAELTEMRLDGDEPVPLSLQQGEA